LQKSDRRLCARITAGASCALLTAGGDESVRTAPAEFDPVVSGALQAGDQPAGVEEELKPELQMRQEENTKSETVTRSRKSAVARQERLL
jgi:hypothetical protein